VQLDAPTAPVGASEIQHDHFVFGLGLSLRLWKVGEPFEFRCLNLNECPAGEQSDCDFFIFYFIVRELDAREFGLFNPNFFPAYDGRHGLALQRPPVERIVHRLAHRGISVKRPFAIRVHNRDIGIRADLQRPFGQSQQSGRAVVYFAIKSGRLRRCVW